MNLSAMPLAPAGYRWGNPVVCSRLHRWLCLAVMLLVSLLLPRCAAPRAIPVPRPAESAAVAPTSDKARKQLGVARETLHDLKGGLDTAVAEADRLRKQKTANEMELTHMWVVLTQEQDRAKALWGQLQESQATVDDLHAKALARDIETDQLRKAVDTLNGRVATAEKWRQKAEPKVAVYDFFVRWIRWLIAGAVIFGLLYVIVRYWPAIAARFFKPI